MNKHYYVMIIVFFCSHFAVAQSILSPDTDKIEGLQTEAVYEENMEECTIGVASGAATPDGRPMVWKTRDNSTAPNNKIKYVTSYTYDYVCVGTANSTNVPWMGVNEKGLAIVNSMIYDLPGGSGPGNGVTMAYALAYCSTIEEFQAHLDSTNVTGRSTTSNFALIDATGAAAIFETGGNTYNKFDALDTPTGYIIRTNFSLTGGGNEGIQRFNRSSALIENFYSGDSLNHKSILRHQMRDFSDFDSEPIEIPYPHVWAGSTPLGYFPTNVSICRDISVSTAVILGVLPEEHPELTTLWAMLGNPAAAITIPYWPVGEPPSLASGPITAPLCDLSNEIRELLYDLSSYSSYINSYLLQDGEGGGLWTYTFPTEDNVLENAEELLNEWRVLDSIPTNAMLDTEEALAEFAYDALEAYLNQTSVQPALAGAGNIRIHPNPASDHVNVDVEFGKARSMEGWVCDAAGRLIRQLFDFQNMAGPALLTFDFSDLEPGAYILVIEIDQVMQTKKVIKL